MCRLFCSLIFIIANVLSVCAQHVVQGVVYDNDTRRPLNGANVVYNVDDKLHGTVTDVNGKYKIELPQNRSVILTVSFTGYRSFSKLVTGSNDAVIDCYLVTETSDIGEAVITAHHRIVQHGDTTRVNLAPYIPNEDSNVMDAIKGVPSISIQGSQLVAQGEVVSQVRLGNKNFFGDDVALVLKNIPANIIKEISIYDARNDYSDATGFDDGSHTKVIDLTPKSSVDHSILGKYYAGYGTENRYDGYMMTNIFDEDRRLALFGQANNISQQDFSTIDLLSSSGSVSANAPTKSPYTGSNGDASFHQNSGNGVSMSSVSEYGVTALQGIGANYSDKSRNGKVELSGHYMFNNSSNSTTYDVTDDYFADGTARTRQTMDAVTDNINHRFNTKFTFSPTDCDLIVFRPSVYYQCKQDNTRQEIGEEADGVASFLAHQDNKSHQQSVSTANELMYVHTFNSMGHSLSADVRFNYNITEENSDLHLYALDNVNQDEANELEDNRQHTYSQNYVNSTTALASYIIPFTRELRFKVDAGYHITLRNIKRKTLLNVDEQTTKIDSLLSGATRSNYGGFHANAALSYVNDNIKAIAGAEFHRYDMLTKNDQTSNTHSFNTVLPYAVFRINWDEQNVWSMDYHTDQTFPTLFQLQDAINNSDPAQSIRGYSALRPAYNHHLSSRFYTKFSHRDFLVFFVNYSYSKDYIGTRRDLSGAAQDKRIQMLSFLNADGYHSESALLAYGFPVKKLNFNTSSQIRYANVPGNFDNKRTNNHELAWTSSFTMASAQIARQLDFVIDINGQYNRQQNQIMVNQNVHYWSLSYGAQVNWYFLPNWKIMAEGGHTEYFGEEMKQYNAVILNTSLSWKFLKGRKGELKLSCHDLLNENNSFYQLTTELYRRKVTTNILERYFLLTFIYNISNIKL